MTRPLASPTNGSNSSSIAQAPPPEAVNVESDFVVILAALLCALICVVGLIAVARCAWLRRATGLSSGSPSRARPSAKANKGLKKKVLQSLPKFVYGSEGAECGVAGAKFGAGECAICLSEFVEGEELRVLPQCGHGFHVVCIDTWLGSHSSCPSCRQILVAARCQKCGQFPGAVGGAEEEQKPRQECEVGNSGGGSSSSSFLP